MGIKKFDVIFPSGLTVRDINTDDDLDRLGRFMEMPQVKQQLASTPYTGGAFERGHRTAFAQRIGSAVKALQ
jgi:hypothetical protein